MPSNKPHNLILALHPAKRSLGICVMEQHGTQRRDILVAGVKMFRGEGKAKQVRDYVAGLLRDVMPSVLVMEERIGERRGKGTGEHRGTEAKQWKEREAPRTGDHRGGKAKEHRRRGTRRTGECKERGKHGAGDTFADKLYEFIEEAAKRSSVQLRLYSARHIKRSLCGDESATWYQVSQAVVEEYGE